MKEVVLEVRGLKKHFGNTEALKGVSLYLSRGEVLGILGPNGAGKTTLINILLGLIKPDEGSIRYFGMDFKRHRSEILQRVNFGSTYVALPYSLTLIENLRVYARIYGATDERCESLLKEFGLYHLKDKTARHLSTGQMTRLCLAKALINEPDVLLLDEPTAGLDPEIARQTRKTILKMVKEKALSVVYTSHNLREMEEVASRVVFLKEGAIIAEGPKEELLKNTGTSSLEDFFFEVLRQ
ncbi:MAG: ABC transporter ATP-binding protein [Nitrospirae bacterium]|nr:MAG: ABC transporter ATP-binding protein [Nitrospirota bacterium]